MRENAIRYQYAYDMFTNLCDEYTYRYGKVHLTDTKLRDVLNNIPNNCKLGEWSEPPQCMPDEYKHKDYITAYKQYYIGEKKRFAKYTGVDTPDFMC